MSKITAPPLYEAMVDNSNAPMPAWTIFFNRLFTGDTGTDWTPTFTGLTETGTPTITGKYYAISKSLIYFRVVVTPATDTSSVAGTTYINNFPLSMRNHGLCGAALPAAGLGGTLGVCDYLSGRIYTPVWTLANVPVIVIGMVEAQ